MDDLDLLRRFEPILRFNRVELFLPSDADAYVAACSLWHRMPDGTEEMVAGPGDLDLDVLAAICRDRAADTLHLLYVQEPLSRRQFRQWRREGHGEAMPGANRFSHVGITGRIIDALFRLTLLFRGRVPRGSVAAAEITYRESIAAAGTPYYGRVSREAGWTILQYWFFYPMNDWRSSFHGINDHEADWENIIVYAAPDEDGVLEARWVAFSSHDAEGDGLRHRADDDDLEWIGDHVVAYPGAGSHSHTPMAMDELVRVDPPVMKRFVRAVRRILRALTPWEDHSSLDEGFGIPFVDYHRGDGVSVGPGADREWAPVVIGDDTPWVRDFSGRWGRDSHDRFGGESAPTGPKHERDGIDRVRWEDPLGWAGMQKIDPDPHAAARAIDERLASVNARIRAIDDETGVLRATSRRENAELRALDADVVTQALATERRTELGERDAAMLALRDERRHLAAERDAMQAAADAGLAPESPRAHRGPDPACDESTPKHASVRSRVLRIWAAVSTPLLMVVIVWMLVGTDSHYYWLGAIGGLLLVIGFEALARRRLMAFLVWVAVLAAGTAIVIGVISRWQYALAVLLAIGAVVLLVQNLRELRSSR